MCHLTKRGSATRRNLIEYIMHIIIHIDTISYTCSLLSFPNQTISLTSVKGRLYCNVALNEAHEYFINRK